MRHEMQHRKYLGNIQFEGSLNASIEEVNHVAERSVCKSWAEYGYVVPEGPIVYRLGIVNLLP